MIVIFGLLEDDFFDAFLREQAVWGSMSKYLMQNDSVCRPWEKGTGHYIAYLIPVNINQSMFWLSFRP